MANHEGMHRHFIEDIRKTDGFVGVEPGFKLEAKDVLYMYYENGGRTNKNPFDPRPFPDD